MLHGQMSQEQMPHDLYFVILVSIDFGGGCSTVLRLCCVVIVTIFMTLHPPQANVYLFEFREKLEI